MTTVRTCARDGKEVKYRKDEGKIYWWMGGDDKKPTSTHLLRASYTIKGHIHPKGPHTP